jgi:hypothetical protein
VRKLILVLPLTLVAFFVQSTESLRWQAQEIKSPAAEDSGQPRIWLPPAARSF